MAESIEITIQTRLGDTCRGFMIGFAIGGILGVVGAIVYVSQFHVG
jgi:galactitol-specific phosphotransferase system IIC component